MHTYFVSALILTVSANLAAAQCELSCPDGYFSFNRTPTDKNSKTSLWCVKPIFPSEPINVTTGRSLCAAESAVITTYENEAERDRVLSALKEVLSAEKKSAGSIIVDGHRVPECETSERRILKAEPCDDNLKAFEVDDAHTDPTFMLQHFADTEPSATAYQKEVESCLALSVSVYPKRNGGANDYLCNYAKAPGNPNTVEFWNFGVLCGKLPNF